jgi:flagellar motor switch protein FliG
VFDINDIKKINNVLEKHLTPDVLAKGQKHLQNDNIADIFN